ncbi:MAG: VOC family protein, partial [Actinobacteria bacterium]|nr:VOC family protein [Actinomycetota bacterium]
MHPSPAVRVARLGYVGFSSPDVARLLEYYTNVLDFELVENSPSRAFLTTGFDHHCVVIEKAEAMSGRTFVGFEVHGSLDDAAKRLTDRGYEIERRTDVGPGTPDVLVLLEPATGTPLHLYESQLESGVATSAGVRPSKLGHVAAFTPDLSDMQGFYQELLGFRWSDTIGDFFV